MKWFLEQLNKKGKLGEKDKLVEKLQKELEGLERLDLLIKLNEENADHALFAGGRRREKGKLFILSILDRRLKIRSTTSNHESKKLKECEI